MDNWSIIHNSKNTLLYKSVFLELWMIERDAFYTLFTQLFIDLKKKPFEF